MGRPKNVFETIDIKIATSPRVCELLDKLLATQLHGKNRAEVAEEVLRLRLRESADEIDSHSNQENSNGNVKDDDSTGST